MNFQSALMDLFSGKSNTMELTRKHHLSSEQIAALDAVSKHIAGSMDLQSLPGCSIRMS